MAVGRKSVELTEKMGLLRGVRVKKESVVGISTPVMRLKKQYTENTLNYKMKVSNTYMSVFS